jgi:catechol-2,3-dioxygenase
MFLSLKRAVYQVKDLERAQQWYRGVLGRGRGRRLQSGWRRSLVQAGGDVDVRGDRPRRVAW